MRRSHRALWRQVARLTAGMIGSKKDREWMALFAEIEEEARREGREAVDGGPGLAVMRPSEKDKREARQEEERLRRKYEEKRLKADRKAQRKAQPVKADKPEKEKPKKAAVFWTEYYADDEEIECLFDPMFRHIHDMENLHLRIHYTGACPHIAKVTEIPATVPDRRQT